MKSSNYQKILNEKENIFISWVGFCKKNIILLFKTLVISLPQKGQVEYVFNITICISLFSDFARKFDNSDI